MVDLLIKAIVLAFGVALLISKRYRCLRLVQLYAFGSICIGLFYTNLFHNWYFYLFTFASQAVLFTLAYWEVNKKLENRRLPWLLPVLVAIVSVPFWALPFLVKLAVPFLIINLFVASDLSYAFFRSKNSFLRVWTVTSSFALVLTVGELLLSKSEIVALLGTIGLLPRIMGDIALLLIVIWQPMMAWIRPRVRSYLPKVANLVPAFASANEKKATELQAPADVINFPINNQKAVTQELPSMRHIADDMDLLEPLLMSATRMISLSNKPFLNCEELCDYLNLNEDQIESFLYKYNIRKFQLIEDGEQWVVRRHDVENIPTDDDTERLHKQDEF